MPANHCIPHTPEAKAKMSAARLGKPAPWRHRPTKIIDGVIHYRCATCKGFFQREDFHSNRRTLLGIKTQCKPCHNATNISSRNKENKRIKAVAYEATRRARKAGAAGSVTTADWFALLEILGRACLKCGVECEPTQDHVVPLAKGGAHHPSNLQPLCRSCNERKQARTADYRTAAQREAVAARWVVEFRGVAP